MIAYALHSEYVLVFLDGQQYTIPKSATNYKHVVSALNENDIESLRSNVTVKKSIDLYISKEMVIDGEKILYQGFEIPASLPKRIVAMRTEGLKIVSMVRFVENLMQNPSYQSVQELDMFLEACELPITEDGHFIAYKKVRSDFTDVHSGKFDNSPGKVVSMPRNQVDDNRENTCGRGLHFCSKSYLNCFGGQRVVLVKINPADVVSIPSDYNNAKGRAWRYEVIQEIPMGASSYSSVESSSVYGVSAPLDKADSLVRIIENHIPNRIYSFVEWFEERYLGDWEEFDSVEDCVEFFKELHTGYNEIELALMLIQEIREFEANTLARFYIY